MRLLWLMKAITKEHNTKAELTKRNETIKQHKPQQAHEQIKEEKKDEKGTRY